MIIPDREISILLYLEKLEYLDGKTHSINSILRSLIFDEIEMMYAINPFWNIYIFPVCHK
jgi:hypothetical protein